MAELSPVQWPVWTPEPGNVERERTKLLTLLRRLSNAARVAIASENPVVCVCVCVCASVRICLRVFSYLSICVHYSDIFKHAFYMIVCAYQIDCVHCTQALHQYV